MNCYDPLYGLHELPASLEMVICCPEVQRLRDIALLNAPSVSLPALAEAKRYSHTLGVCRLSAIASQALAEYLTDEQRRTLVYATAVHDVGTPPFGHTMEYLFRRHLDWSHERQLEAILRGQYRPEGIHHQILPGYTLRLPRLLSELAVDVDAVLSCVRGDGILGPLLAGTVDLDNIDNVIRMSHYLGLMGKGDRQLGPTIAGTFVSDGVRIGLPAAAKPLVERWLLLRERCYSLLLFDPLTVGMQAILYRVLERMIDQGALGVEYWHMRDNELLSMASGFRGDDEIKLLARRIVAGDPYRPATSLWIAADDCSRLELDLDGAMLELRSHCESIFGSHAILYTFRDRGAMGKSITLLSGTGWDVQVGSKSNTLVVTVAVPSTHDSSRGKVRDFRKEVVRVLGVSLARLRTPPTPEDVYGITRQETLPL